MNYYNSNIYKDTLRLVRGNDFATVNNIVAKYPDDTEVEGFDLNVCTDLGVRIRRNGSSFKDIETYAETWSIIEPKKIRIDFDGLKMKNGSYRIEFFGKFQDKDWRCYSEDKGFGIVESNEDANIPADTIIADGVYQILTDFTMTYLIKEQSDWEETDDSMPSYIKNKPTIPTTLRELEGDSTHRTVTDSDKAYWDAKSDFSGSYDDLTDKPTIPEELSDLSDDSTHRLVTDSEKISWDSKYAKPSSGIPASDIASGVIPDVSQFITKSVNDLVNYYTKSQTYTQSEVNSLIAGISSFDYEVVATLPTASASTMHKIYLTPSPDPQTQNVKDEYITIQSGSTYSWEQIGSTAIDLSGYVTTQALNTALADYTTTDDLSTLLAGYYQKPSGGIPATDLASAVQTSLGKADTAIQSVKVNGTALTPDANKAVDVSVPINLHVELTKTGNTYTANYTYAQIEAAINSGGYVDLMYAGFIYTYDGTDGVIYFLRVDSENIGATGGNICGHYIKVYANNEWVFNNINMLANDVPSVIDSLSSESTTAALSAKQGKVLSDTKQATIDATHKLSADFVDDTSTTNKFATSTEKATWNGKQDALVSGTNIKTINNESILGSGNMTITGSTITFRQW